MNLKLLSPELGLGESFLRSEPQRKELLSESRKKIPVISLFTGCGGLDLGFSGGFSVPKVCITNKDFIAFEMRDKVFLKANPFEVVFCNDIMLEAKKVWQANSRSKAEYSTESIHDLKSSSLPQAELIIGGFPCQDFSLAGKRKGFQAERGRLYEPMARLVHDLQPKVFFAENVFGLLTMKGAIETIKAEFEKGGYKVFHYPVEAQHYGVAQMRKRVFIVGVNKALLKREVMDKDFFAPPSHPSNYVRLKDIFHTLLEPDRTNDPDQRSYSKARFYGSKCQGNKAVDMDRVAPTMRAEHHGNIEFRRLGSGGMGNDRRLTIREVAMIQSFPEEFFFTERGGKKLLTQSAAYRVLGNAVPPLLAYHFARRLYQVWEDIF